MKPYLRRATADLQEVCDLAVRKAFHLLENEDCPQLLRELRERVAQRQKECLPRP